MNSKSLALLFLIAIGQECKANEPPWSAFAVGTELSATLSSGRIVRGALDARTTNDRLCLTMMNDGMSVSSIVRREEINALALTNSTANRRGLVADKTPNTPSPLSTSKDQKNIKHAHSLSVFAHVDNWNADSKVDGIRLYLIPRGARGELIPVSGSVSVQLSVYRGDARNTAGRYREEESWACELSTSDYDQTSAMLVLPFRRIQPDSDREIFVLGSLTVRLKIAGQGVLEANLNDVELRNRSYTDELRGRR